LAADGDTMIESRGTFYLLRPNRFRWDYESPSEQLIVADGKRIYIPTTKNWRRSVTAARRRSSTAPRRSCSPATSHPRTYFTMRNIDRGDKRVWAELVPKTSETDVEKLQIGFADGELDTLVMEDRFGQLTRFIFSDVDRNPKLKYSMFRFKRPRGADFLAVD
jgi:outer membrane lipoprotein carrier protein